MIRQLLRSLGVIAVCAAALPLAVVVTVLASFLFLPLPATLPEANPAEGGQISRVVTVSGEEIGQFREFEQNIPFKYEDIPLHMKQAVIAAEDKNFYEHGGVDIGGSTRALLADLRGGGITQGGSTITQQYVKNAYTNKERTVTRKVREAILASQLDRQVDKEEILYRYLSSIYLGEGAYGVGAASETYFRKPVNQLNVSEAALLAGLIPAPSRYEPRGNAELAEVKRQIVLRKMFEQGFIDQAAYDVAVLQKVFAVTAEVPTPPPGQPATFVHPPVQPPSRYPYFLDYVKRYLLERYPAELIDKGGLTIITTIDPRVQDEAERARNEALKGTGPPLEMSIVAVEPPTGYVKALVGGRDFNAPGGAVNLALGRCPIMPTDPQVKLEVEAACWAEDAKVVNGGGTGRQPGSAFKPFVLAAAFAKGFPPSKVYSGGSPYAVPGGSIDNFGGASYGAVSLRQATHQSVNTAYARLLKDVGLKETAEMTKKLGISSAWYSPRVQGLSYTLGTQEVAPLEMASAYGVFAARGKRLPPTPILQIKDLQGRILEDNIAPKADQVVDEPVADNVTDVMRGVITGGTGTRANINRPAAGKTGTAQGSKDSWFVGFTPTLSTAVWIGYRDTPAPMRNIRGCRGGMTGGCLPAQTWKSFMLGALKDVPVTDFSQPAPIRRIADELKRQARQGIDPGGKRTPTGTDEGGPYVFAPTMPRAVPPPRPTTTTTPPEEPDPGTDPEDDAGGDPGDDAPLIPSRPDD